MELAEKPEQGFDIDARAWHKYRIVNRDGHLTIFVDGVKKLETAVAPVFTRHVRFGNRAGFVSKPAADGTRITRTPLHGTQYGANAGLSRWRQVAVKVSNRRDHSIDWKWTPAQGYPDQFRRDRVIRLEKCGSFAAGDCGYSGWDQLADGSVVVVDYNTGTPATRRPVLRSYLLPSALLK